MFYQMGGQNCFSWGVRKSKWGSDSILTPLREDPETPTFFVNSMTHLCVKCYFIGFWSKKSHFIGNVDTLKVKNPFRFMGILPVYVKVNLLNPSYWRRLQCFPKYHTEASSLLSLQPPPAQHSYLKHPER